MAAVALPDHGAVIEPINSALPVAIPSASASASPTASASAHPTPAVTAPKHVNSKLPHPDGLAWSPDAKQLAVAVNGEIELYGASAADGAPPATKFLAGANVVGVAWSGPIAPSTLAGVKAGAAPPPTAHAPPNPTRLPAH